MPFHFGVPGVVGRIRPISFVSHLLLALLGMFQVAQGYHQVVTLVGSLGLQGRIGVKLSISLKVRNLERMWEGEREGLRRYGGSQISVARDLERVLSGVHSQICNNGFKSD